jgi:hypothetical protein
MWRHIKKFIFHIFSNDNSKVNTGTLFAVVSLFISWAIVLYYAFWLKTDIGPNMVALLGILVGSSGGGFIASLFQKYVGSVNIPPEDK